MKKILLWLVGLLVLLVVIVHFWLPDVAEFVLEHGLAEKVGVEGAYDVEVEASTGLKLLLGKYDRITFDGADLDIGGLRVAKYSIVADAGEVNIFALLGSKEVAAENPQMARISLYVTPKDLEKWLQERLKAISNLGVTLSTDSVLIGGDIDLLGHKLPITMQSTAKVDGEHTILLTLEDIDVSGEEIPDTFRNKLEEIPISLRYTKLPTYVESVEIRENGIYIEANTVIMR